MRIIWVHAAETTAIHGLRREHEKDVYGILAANHRYSVQKKSGIWGPKITPEFRALNINRGKVSKLIAELLAPLPVSPLFNKKAEHTIYPLAARPSSFPTKTSHFPCPPRESVGFIGKIKSSCQKLDLTT